MSAPEQFEFSKNELERYSRQILLYGKEAQKRLKSSHVTVVGAGGIGSGLLPYLAAAGVGKITIFDFDLVDRPNLGRQILFSESQIGQNKAQAAAEFLRKLNPYIQIFPIEAKFEKESQIKMGDVCFLLEGSDDIPTKFLVNDLSLKLNIPAIIGGIGNIQGHIFHIDKRVPDCACYRCVFEKPPPEGLIPNCATTGVISPLPGVIGTMMAYSAVKSLTENKPISGLYLLDQANWRTLQMKQSEFCKVCSKFTNLKGLENKKSDISL